MQKLVREYLDELNRRRKKGRKISVAVILLAVIVISSVAGVLAQYGVAMTGTPKCGLQEHGHSKDCYTNELACGLEEGEGHTHTQNCQPQAELACGQEEAAGHTHTEECSPQAELACGQKETEAQDGEEGHTHTQDCYAAPEGFACGQEEAEGHAHTEGCYTIPEGYVCGLEETEGHTHKDECYKENLTCEKQEHTHTDICYTDASADVEDPAAWENQYAAVEWKGNWAEDLAEAARMQLGYRESANNYVVAEDGSHKGYTRYGHFSGDMYCSWDAAFVNFCLHYAGIAASGWFPQEADTAKWQEEFIKIREENAAFFTAPAGYEPQIGDLVFMQKQNEETPGQMAVVASYNSEAGEITVIEGNSANEVKENAYQAAGEYIISYLKTSELEEAYRQSAENPEEPAAEPEKPKKKNAAKAGASLTDDGAYVKEITVTDVIDGSVPFDEADGPGNDANENNRIVRTFDSVNYNFQVSMDPWSERVTYSEARVKLEFVLPLTEEEAVFDQTAMGWMDTAAGYEPKLTKEIRSIDGNDVECQVLTCYKYLLPSEGNDSVIPGTFGNNVTVNVKSMQKGKSFAPVFSAAMEHGTWEGECTNPEHQMTDGEGNPAYEKKTVTAEPVTVTAAPKYNIKIDGEHSYRDTFDFSTGNDAAVNKDKGQVTGRIMKMGITIQLYNDNASKGLKGIELPSGPIEFDLELSSKYGINAPTEGHQVGEEVPTTSEYMPLLWSYGGNWWTPSGAANATDGRILYDASSCSAFAPGYEGELPANCNKSGTWSVTGQEGNVVHIIVDGYEIDLNHMPTQNLSGGDNIYGPEVGCFSAGAFWVVQPFNKLGEGSGNEGPNFDVVKEYGSGFFTTTAEVKNMKATTVNGETVQEGVDGYQQMRQNDDEINRTLELIVGGYMQNRVRYADGEDIWLGAGVENNTDGRDYAAVGSEIHLMGGFSYTEKQEHANQLYWGTNLTKFYGSAIELKEEEIITSLTGGAELDGRTEPDQEHCFAYYATKRDGSDWASDDELQRTYEDDLVFYKNLSDIPSDHICVGILFCFKGPGPVSWGDPYYRAFHKAQVREDAELAGNAFMLASTSRLWTKEMFQKAGMGLDDIPDWSDDATTLKDFPEDMHKSANIEGSTFYRKEVYREDGSEDIEGTHNSDWEHWGDTLLVIGYKAKITKNLLQVDNNNEEKKTFNLDTDQRVVDFKLQPETKFTKTGAFSLKDKVTIVDTLPKYLSYKPGSAYFGGEYHQTSDDGGTKGEITGGVLTEPAVKENEDGTQTLTWDIPDVEIGEEMPAIYYSADIGSKSDPEQEVPPNATTGLTNKVYITSAYDRRKPSIANGNYAEEGISVVRGNASSFGKYTKQKVVDEDGEIDYVVYFNNNAAQAKQFAIMDTLPANEIAGSKFTGTYRFAEWRIDTGKSQYQPGSIKIYYTADKKYENQVIKDIREETGKNETEIFEGEGWTEASIASDGTIALPELTEGADHPVAWAVAGELQAGQSIYVNLKIELDPGASEQGKENTNYFVNRLSCDTTTTIVENPTVRRMLEGLTWMDYDRNGIQDEEIEDRLSGIKVELLKLTEGNDPEREKSYEPVCYPGTEDPIAIETGQQVSVRAAGSTDITWYDTDVKPEDEKEPENMSEIQGRYRFTDLPAGTFAVRFTDGTGCSISELHATEPDCIQDDTRDSDGIPFMKEDGATLDRTVIFAIEMPSAEEMKVAVYESKFHDSGFYPDTVLKICKTDDLGSRNLAGAVFTIKDAKGKLVSFVSDDKKEGYYTAFQQAEEETPSLADKYYIALAQDPRFVLGIDGSGNGALPVLQKRSKDGTQLFDVQSLDDGSVGFYKAECGMHLDLDGGRLENNAKIHFWSGGIGENKKWILYGNNQDGSSYLVPKSDTSNTYCIGANGNGIYLYQQTHANAEKWILVPAGNSVETQTDLSVASNGRLEIYDLIPGDYSITEIKSPNGYSLLKEPVRFTMDKKGGITLNQDSGGMADIISGEGNEMQLKIRNSKLYELPSTGGSGIYWYSIGGMLLMMAGALILYKNKCREVLES